MLLQLVLAVALAATAIILHELAHGYAALALGDDTARRLGRLSLNPLRHVDRFGTILLPGLLLLGQLATMGRVGFMFGWAKPVPVDASRFQAPRQMMAIVAVAGPLMNFVLAMLGALALRLTLTAPVQDAILIFMQLNLTLGLFNLIPIPPLDGGRIAVGILPLRLARAWAGMERVGLVLMVLLIAVPSVLRSEGVQVVSVIDYVGAAVNWVMLGLLGLAGVGIDRV